MSKAIEPEPLQPDKLCSVCGRVLWGAWQVLPFDKGRHEECAVGSEAWLEHYQTLGQSEQAKLVEFINFSYPQGEGMQPCTQETTAT